GVVRLWRNGEGCDHGDMMAGDGYSTGHSAVPRPRPTGAPQVLAALLALLACPSAAMAVFILVAGQQVALPHLVFCLLQLVILVPLVRGGARWLRPTRLSRPRDATPPLLLLLAAVLVLGVTRLRAYWDGILGSALPRVRSGVRSGRTPGRHGGRRALLAPAPVPALPRAAGPRRGGDPGEHPALRARPSRPGALRPVAAARGVRPRPGRHLGGARLAVAQGRGAG